MANLLAHSLFSLSSYSAVWCWFSGEPLSGFAFVAALVSLLPDVEEGLGKDPSPFAHSVGYLLLWGLLSFSVLSIASSLGLIPSSVVLPTGLAVGLGLGSHLFLDALRWPGILGIPREGRWSRICLPCRDGLSRRLDLLVCVGSTSVLLVLVALF